MVYIENGTLKMLLVFPKMERILYSSKSLAGVREAGRGKRLQRGEVRAVPPQRHMMRSARSLADLRGESYLAWPL